MSSVTTPKINRIYKIDEFTLLNTAITIGNMYMCTDTQKLYYDETSSSRSIYSYTGVRTHNDLLYNITPVIGKSYYCWEDNSLWLWLNKWVSLYSDIDYPSAYVYNDNNDIAPVYANSNLQIMDNNGLLKDGSVVVRDGNRIIKGRMYIDDGKDNLVFSSYFGGGIRFLPNGQMSTQGELYITDGDNNSYIDTVDTAVLSLITDESTITLSDRDLRELQLEINKNNNKAVSSIKFNNSDIIYRLANTTKLNDNTGNIYTYTDSSNSKNYFKVSSKIYAIPSNGSTSYSYLRSELHLMDNDYYVDYSDNPDKDYSPYPKSSHKYKVFHEGNLDTSLIRELTQLDIYNKLTGDTVDKVPDIFDLNVDRLDGKHASDFAPKVHTHTTSQITDFPDASQKQANIVVDNVLSNVSGSGIETSYDANTKVLSLDPNDFSITLSGGVTGTATVKNLSNTTIITSVDPDMHEHKAYIERMDNLQSQIDSIYFDPDLYYTKTDVNNLLVPITPTDTAEAGKALKVNKDLTLPANASSSSKLNHNVDFILDGDVTGHIESDLHTTNITINTDTSNVISSTPQANKALKLDNSLNLNANATSSSKLNHTIDVTLEGEVTGNATLDTSKNTFTIDTLINDATSKVLRQKDIHTTVASLNSSGYVPDKEMNPELLKVTLKPQGNWTPSSTVPSTSPKEGYFWVANAVGDYNGNHYQKGDWILYYDSKWNWISNNENVLSVNGKTGSVTLNSTDVGGISSSYINYTLGSTIPANKIVLTNSNGHIAGATVDKLTKAITISTQNDSDVAISKNSSNTSTDGSSNLILDLQLSNTGLTKISNRDRIYIIGNDIKDSLKTKTLPFANNLIFDNNWAVYNNTTVNTITVTTPYINQVVTKTIGDGTSTAYTVSLTNDNYASDDIEVLDVEAYITSSMQRCYIDYIVGTNQVQFNTNKALKSNELTVKIYCKYKNILLAA